MKTKPMIALIGLTLLCLPEILLLAQDEKPAKDAAVWAVDDTDKVHPISGNLLSEGMEIYSSQQPSPAQHRVRNSIWDAATQTIKLYSGRNEFVSFQVVLEKGRNDLHKVFV